MSLLSLFYNFNENRLRGYIRIAIVSIWVIVAYIASYLISNNITDTFLFTVADELLTCVLVCGAIFLAFSLLDKRTIQKTIFNNSKVYYHQVVFGFIVGFILILINFLFLYLFTDIKVKINYNNENLYIYLLKIIVRLIGFLAVAINEEIFIRGYLLTNFSEIFYNKKISSNVSEYLGLLITSIIFGFLHYFNSNATIISSLNLTFIGLLFGYAFIKTGSLALPIGIHWGWNFTQAQVFGLNVSGFLPMVSIVKTDLIGDTFLSGGRFGPEGGILILISVVIGLILIFLINNSQKTKKINNFVNTKSSIINFYL